MATAKQSELREMLKAQIRSTLGHQMYDEIYRFLVYHRSNETEDDQALYEELQERV